MQKNISPPEKEAVMPPAANHSAVTVSSRRWLWIVTILFGGAALLAAFLGYRQPELLLDFVNLRYCG